MSQTPEDLIDKLAGLLVPAEEKSPVSVSNDFNEFCKKVLEKLDVSSSECLVTKILVDGDIKSVLSGVDNCSTCLDNVQKLNDSDKESFEKLLDALKNRSKYVKRQGNCNRCYNTIYFLLDTCYNENKATNLKNALGEIKQKLGDELFRKFLVLLISSFTKMTKEVDYLLKAEWFPLLVRSASSALTDNDKYFPVCPAKGDVAALLYYCAKEVCPDGRLGPEAGSGGGGPASSITISLDDVKEIVAKLLEPASGATGSSAQGSS